VFLHKHGIAHLDISLRNLLTDYEGHYAYIDYELSRCFNSPVTAVRNYRGTEVPPECETEGEANPFKIDVWALAVLMLRACKVRPLQQAMRKETDFFVIVNRILGSRADASD
jgi:serine/threonine protein kinase